MSEKAHPLPKAKIQKDIFSWFIWTLPVAAAGLCGWFLLHDFIFAGPTVTIYFLNADGLQEQNSMVKYRGINIGQVTTLKLADKQGRVAVRAKLDYSAGDVARQGAIFWIVQPEVKLGAIHGLQTIVSGIMLHSSRAMANERTFLSALRKRPSSLLPELLSPCWPMIWVRWKINQKFLIAASRWEK